MDKTKKKYHYAQRDVDDYSCIKISEGKYEGVIYTYGKVMFASEANQEDKLPLKFEYTVKKNPKGEDTESEEFRTLIGDILVEEIEEQLKNGQLQFNK